MFSIERERDNSEGISGEDGSFRALLPDHEGEPELIEAIREIPLLQEICEALACVGTALKKYPNAHRVSFLFQKLLERRWIHSVCRSSILYAIDERPEEYLFGYTFKEIEESFLNELPDACGQIEEESRHLGANVQKLFPNGVPDDPDIVDLVVQLNAEKGGTKSLSEIARKITGEQMSQDKRAQKLLARIRMMKRRGIVNL